MDRVEINFSLKQKKKKKDWGTLTAAYTYHYFYDWRQRIRKPRNNKLLKRLTKQDFVFELGKKLNLFFF